MELILIRHGQPGRPETGNDPGLSDLGHRQAAAMAGVIGTESIDALVASPQARARETARPLAEALGLELTIDERIAEFDYGLTTYHHPEDMRNLPEDTRQMMFDLMRSPAFIDRVVEGFEDIIVRHPSETVAVVCHGLVIATMIGHVLETPATPMLRAEYTSATRFSVGRSGRRSLRSFNERHWVEALA